MSDSMSSAELTEQCVELLPARTVLSLWRAGVDGVAGAPGEPGTPGAPGQSISGSTSMWTFLMGHDQSDPRSGGDVSGKTG
jgi:hypothetical protein